MVCLAILLSGCGTDDKKSESSEQVPAQPAPPATVQPQGAAKAAIAPPAGWEPVSGSAIPNHYVKKGATFIVKQENFQSKNLDDVVKEAQAAYIKAFTDVKFEGEPETLTVDGKEARKIRFTCKVSGLQMKYEYVYLMAGGVKVITFGAASDTFDELAADFGQILKDIRFE